MAPTTDQQHAIDEVTRALENNAKFIYWDHISHRFDYFRHQDNNNFKEYIKNLKHLTLVVNGEVLEITTDPPFKINGITIFPMIVKFKNCPCPSYMHLRRKSTDNSKWTPFLFTNKKTRQETVAYLTDFYRIIRVNATSTAAYLEMTQKFKDTSDLVSKVKSLINPESFVSKMVLTFWCTDNKRQEIDVWVDDDGRDNKLQPNHRANALVDAGRFKDMAFNDISRRHRVTKNQQLKENQGANYLVGDVCLVVKGGKPYPNLDVYGDNPIEFIANINPPSTRMISQYGEDLAKKLIHPEQTINFRSLIHQTDQLRRSSYDLDAIISRNDKHRQRIIMIDVLKDRDVVWDFRRYGLLTTETPITPSFAHLLCMWMPLCEADLTFSRSDPVRFIQYLLHNSRGRNL